MHMKLVYHLYSAIKALYLVQSSVAVSNVLDDQLDQDLSEHQKTFCWESRVFFVHH